MPFVHIRVAGPRLAPEQVEKLQREATALMAGIMRKKEELTSVLVEQAEISGWAIGGAAVPVAAHLDVKVTQGTNTGEEKARFIKAANDLLKSVLGSQLPVATYVVVHEIPSTAWGYDGLTQEARKLAAAGG